MTRTARCERRACSCCRRWNSCSEQGTSPGDPGLVRGETSALDLLGVRLDVVRGIVVTRRVFAGCALAVSLDLVLALLVLGTDHKPLVFLVRHVSSFQSFGVALSITRRLPFLESSLKTTSPGGARARSALSGSR